MQHPQLENPYEALYKNLNMHVSQSSTKEDAEKIARQLTMLHETFGMVIRDLIKLISFEFKENSSALVQDQYKNRVCQMKQSANKEQGSLLYGQKMDIQNSVFQQQKTPEVMDFQTIFMKKKKQVVEIQIIDSQEEDLGDKIIVSRPRTRSQTKRGGYGNYRTHNLNFQQAYNSSKSKQNIIKSQISMSMEVPFIENDQQKVLTFGNYTENKESSIFKQFRKQKEILLFDNQSKSLKNQSLHNPNIIQKEIPVNIFQREEIQSTVFARLINPITLNPIQQEKNTVASSEQKSEFFEMPNKIFQLLRKKLQQDVLYINDSE